MKKLLSMLLVVSLMLTLVVTGITSVAADYDVTSVSNVSSAADKNIHFYAADAGDIIKLDATTYTVQVKSTVVNQTYKFVVASGYILDGNTYKVGTDGKEFTLTSFKSTVIGEWETVAIDLTSTDVDLTKVNYLSIRSNKTFTLKDQDLTVCFEKSAHEHKWSEEYTTNDTHHWKTCTADCPVIDKQKMDGYAEHTFDDEYDAECVCGFTRNVQAPPSDDDEGTVDTAVYLIDPTAQKDVNDIKFTLKAKEGLTSSVSVGALGDMTDVGSTSAYIYDHKADHIRKSGIYFETPAEIDITKNEKTLVLDMWIYFEPAAGQNAADQVMIVQIIPDECLALESASTGNAFDNYTENWAYRQLLTNHLKTGWNHVELPIDSMTKGNAGNNNEHVKAAYAKLEESKKIAGITFHENRPDASGPAIDYVFGVASIKIRDINDVDNDDNGNDDDGEEDTTKTRSYFVSNTESGVSGGGVANQAWEDTSIPSQGLSGQSFNVATVNASNGVFTIAHTGVDVSTKIGEKASYYFYVSDVSNLKWIQWEIASSGTFNGACMRYWMKEDVVPQVLKNGWNKINFEIVRSDNIKEGVYSNEYSDIYEVGGGGGMTGNLDYEHINYIRFVMQTVSTQKDLKVAVFNFQFGGSTSTGDETPIVNIALLTLAAALVAGGVFFYNKKRATR